MARRSPWITLISALLLISTLSGCGATRPTAGPVTTPAEANAVLDGRLARITFSSGQVADAATDVYLAPDITTYRERRGATRVEVPTADVHSVGVRVRTGRARGALIGSLPGVGLAGLGTGMLLLDGSLGSLVAGGGALVLGVAAAGAGAVVGMLVGDAVTDDVYQVVYEAPRPDTEANATSPHAAPALAD